jgi:hypothetical protein
MPTTSTPSPISGPPVTTPLIDPHLHNFPEANRMTIHHKHGAHEPLAEA